MKIYFNGDSNIAGTELGDPVTQGFAFKLANKLGATSFINEARHGASNSLILRYTNMYLTECRRIGSFPDFVVIGWSQCNREDWYVDGQYCSISSIGLQNPELVDPESFEYWTVNCHRNMIFLQQMSKFYNRAIHNLHLELNDLKIPHLFFNAINTLNHCEVASAELSACVDNDPILKLRWNDQYYKPYDEVNSTWRSWALENNYKQVTNGLYHFEESCQEAWAQLMHDYIKEKHLV